MNWNIGQTILNLYEVRQVFTSGGMGLVYRVHHTGWGIDMALKHPKPELLTSHASAADFERECETWVQLGLHPHVATCFYTRHIERVPCVFAEFVEGGSLRDWIKSRRLYQGSEEQALARMLGIAIQFAWGLDWARQKGLVHQDVKPGNVLMCPDGTAKVTDFGLAKALRPRASADGAPALLATQSGMTPAYCSPEQAAHQPLTPATDVWSWAVSLIEMFMGDIFWQQGPAAPAVLGTYADHGCRAAGVPTMPQPVLQLLKTCLVREPTRRPTLSTLASGLLENYEDLFGEPFELVEPDGEVLVADSLNNRALSLADLGKVDEGIHFLDAALRIDPDHEQARHNRKAILEAKRSHKPQTPLLFAFPRSGAEHAADAQRFKRLLGKIEVAIGERRLADAARYVQLAKDLPAFCRHPRLKRAEERLTNTPP